MAAPNEKLAKSRDVLKGNHAPDFSLKSLDGKNYSLKSLLQNGAVIATFFKVSCPTCQFTFPFLQRLYERYRGDGVTFVAISQDDGRDTEKFNKKYGVTFPTLLDAPGYPISNAYGLATVPTIFLIEPDGTVKISCTGFSKSDLEQIAKELAQRRQVAAAPLIKPEENVPAFKPG
jgi:cytochrome c biogenesis protein CcmG/thiol:disulfide interchange protein DsbE